jgi:hypothetical protein
MRILFLTPQRPYPPHQGTTLRNLNLIKELANRHQICVLSFLEPDQDPDDSGPLPEWCHWIETLPVPERTTGTRLRQLVTTRRPDMSWRLWSPAFDDRLARRLQEQPFDVVSIEGIEMAPYLPTIEQAQPKPLVIYDAHNAEWILQKRAFATDIMTPSRWLVAAYSWVQWHRLLRYEADLMERAAHTVAMSQKWIFDPISMPSSGFADKYYRLSRLAGQARPLPPSAGSPTIAWMCYATDRG